LALPLFVIAWIFAPRVNQILCVVSMKKYVSEHSVALLAIAAIFIWTLTHQNFSVLRDESLVGILNAVIMCASMMFLSRRYFESEFRPSQLIKNTKWKSRASNAVVPVVLAMVALSAIGAGWAEMVLQVGSVGVGIICGWLLNWKNAADRDPKLLTGALMLLVSYGLIMQPEFFRFGQFANLTMVHMLCLVSVSVSVAIYMALHFIKPGGFLKKLSLNRVRMVMRAMAMLILVLLLVTESAFVFIIFFAMAFIYFALGVRHMSADALRNKLKQEMWLVSLFLFGVLATLPAVSVAAILLWRASSRKDFPKKMRELL